MSFGAKLLHHYPGTLTAIEIPLCDGSFGEISYKTIVNSLVAESNHVSAIVGASGSTAVTLPPHGPVFTEPKHRSNTYDNIIERLERKYTTQKIVCDSESDDDDENMFGDFEAEVGTEKNDTKISKRKRRSNLYDAYDFDGKITIYGNFSVHMINLNVNVHLFFIDFVVLIYFNANK